MRLFIRKEFTHLVKVFFWMESRSSWSALIRPFSKSFLSSSWRRLSEYRLLMVAASTAPLLSWTLNNCHHGTALCQCLILQHKSHLTLRLREREAQFEDFTFAQQFAPASERRVNCSCLLLSSRTCWQKMVRYWDQNIRLQDYILFTITLQLTRSQIMTLRTKKLLISFG